MKCYKKMFSILILITFTININLIAQTQTLQEQAINTPSNQKIEHTLEELLCLYLENDLELKKLTLEVEKSKLNLRQAKIEQGFNVTLSTGTMTFYKSQSSSVITIKPSVKATLPTAKNLSLNFSTDYQYKTSTKTNELKDTKLQTGIDIISSSDELSKITILKSERELLDSQRKVQATALLAEKKFFNELSEILNIANQIYTYLQDVYTDKLNLEKLKAQGYSPSSSTYRIAQMKVSSGEHDIETGFHNLKKNLVIFYNHCGINIELTNDMNFEKLIPTNIPEKNALTFTDFDKSKYSPIEKATWTFNINELTRKAEKYFSLGINGGYTFNNSTTKTDTVDAGISTSLGGIGINAGINVPLQDQNFNPAFNLSTTISPSSFLTKNITKQKNELSKEQELIDIKNAEREYDTAVIDFEQTASNLNWEKQTVNQNLKIYQKNEEDLFKYFKMGIITESEWLTAKNTRQLYEIKSILNKLEYILYNNNVMSQFVDIDFTEFNLYNKLGEQNNEN